MQNCCLSFKIPEKNYKGMDLGTQCIASCEVNAIYGCENVLRENSAHRWASSIIDNYQWIQLNFTYAHQVQVEMEAVSSSKDQFENVFDAQRIDYKTS
ncbi:hypothetical protein LSH36_632g00001 [Paralvinella palmiformis]|uniref:Uncharacterized protein n=1 Tax=Paralvinella palmiformis TaxID=53620 RepID=A0AAD9MW63_9ANNE|nr:hypothetical protein LSH36_632g00001 [Paralvinella palmiformis]